MFCLLCALTPTPLVCVCVSLSLFVSLCLFFRFLPLFVVVACQLFSSINTHTHSLTSLFHPLASFLFFFCSFHLSHHLPPSLCFVPSFSFASRPPLPLSLSLSLSLALSPPLSLFLFLSLSGLRVRSYAGVEVRKTPNRTEIIILATRTQEVVGEKGRRIRELTGLVKQRFGFKDNVELFAEKVANRGLCAMAQCESIRYKLLGGLAVRRLAPKKKRKKNKNQQPRPPLCSLLYQLLSTVHVCPASLTCVVSFLLIAPSCLLPFFLSSSAIYGVLRLVMDSGAMGCEVIISGKLRAQRAKSMKFSDGFFISSGHPAREYVDTAVRHVQLRQGVLGIKVKIMKPHDPTGKIGPMTKLPDTVRHHSVCVCVCACVQVSERV